MELPLSAIHSPSRNIVDWTINHWPIYCCVLCIVHLLQGLLQAWFNPSFWSEQSFEHCNVGTTTPSVLHCSIIGRRCMVWSYCQSLICVCLNCHTWGLGFCPLSVWLAVLPLFLLQVHSRPSVFCLSVSVALLGSRFHCNVALVVLWLLTSPLSSATLYSVSCSHVCVSQWK